MSMNIFSSIWSKRNGHNLEKRIVKIPIVFFFQTLNQVGPWSLWKAEFRSSWVEFSILHWTLTLDYNLGTSSQVAPSTLFHEPSLPFILFCFILIWGHTSSAWGLHLTLLWNYYWLTEGGGIGCWGLNLGHLCVNAYSLNHCPSPISLLI